MDPITINPLFVEIGLPALLGGLVLGGLIAWFVQRRRQASLEERIKNQEALAIERDSAIDAANARLVEAFSNLSSKSLEDNSKNFLLLAKEHLGQHSEVAKAELEKREKAVEVLVKPIQNALEASEKKIQEIEKDRKEAYGGIHSLLNAMKDSQASLTQETQNLVKALRRPEVRGRWGEMTLRRLVELAGMVDHCDFIEQVHTDNEGAAIRPDMVIKLPEGRDLIIDVKTPLDAYLDANEAEDEAQRKNFLQKHANNVRGHINSLSGKAYWEALDTPEFVILFIPNEQFLSAAIQELPDLFDYALDKHIILTTPASLIALLKGVAYSWQQVALAENAKEIRKLAEDLHSRLGTFRNHMVDVGKRLGGSVDAYNKAIGSLEHSVLPGARRFPELGVREKKKLETLEPLDKTPRPVTYGIEHEKSPENDDNVVEIEEKKAE